MRQDSLRIGALAAGRLPQLRRSMHAADPCRASARGFTRASSGIPYTAANSCGFVMPSSTSTGCRFLIRRWTSHGDLLRNGCDQRSQSSRASHHYRVRPMVPHRQRFAVEVGSRTVETFEILILRPGHRLLSALAFEVGRR